LLEGEEIDRLTPVQLTCPDDEQEFLFACRVNEDSGEVTGMPSFLVFVVVLFSFLVFSWNLSLELSAGMDLTVGR
jgi:hypothetical protein